MSKTYEIREVHMGRVTRYASDFPSIQAAHDALVDCWQGYVVGSFELDPDGHDAADMFLYKPRTAMSKLFSIQAVAS